MSNFAPKPEEDEIAAKFTDLAVGLKGLFGLVLLILSIPNIIAARSIPVFQSIFQDALPGKPLPAVTLAVIGHPGLLEILAVALPIAAMIVIVPGEHVRLWVAIGTLIGLAIGLQVMLTTFALYIPMLTIIVGVP
jgi:hypothetical protein